MQQALPDALETTRIMAGDLIKHTLSAGGKAFSEEPRTITEIDAYADAMADMFCAYIMNLCENSCAAPRSNFELPERE